MKNKILLAALAVLCFSGSAAFAHDGDHYWRHDHHWRNYDRGYIGNGYYGDPYYGQSVYINRNPWRRWEGHRNYVGYRERRWW